MQCNFLSLSSRCRWTERWGRFHVRFLWVWFRFVPISTESLGESALYCVLGKEAHSNAHGSPSFPNNSLYSLEFWKYARLFFPLIVDQMAVDTSFPDKAWYLSRHVLWLLTAWLLCSIVRSHPGSKLSFNRGNQFGLVFLFQDQFLRDVEPCPELLEVSVLVGEQVVLVILSDMYLLLSLSPTWRIPTSTHCTFRPSIWSSSWRHHFCRTLSKTFSRCGVLKIWRLWRANLVFVTRFCAPRLDFSVLERWCTSRLGFPGAWPMNGSQFDATLENLTLCFSFLSRPDFSDPNPAWEIDSRSICSIPKLTSFDFTNTGSSGFLSCIDLFDMVLDFENWNKMVAGKHREIHDLKHTEKMIPLITGEITSGQSVS